MLPLTMLGFLCGVLLGYRFNVFALIPAVLIGCAASAIVAAGTGWSLALAIVVAAVVLQLGYFAGAWGRHVLCVDRLCGGHREQVQIALPVQHHSPVPNIDSI
jgi:hypothetical protein